MTHDLTRRLVLAGLTGGLAQAALAAAPPQSLRPAMRGDADTPPEPPAAEPGDPAFARPRARPDDLGKPRVAELRDLIARAGLGGDLSICLRDVGTGAVVESWQADHMLPPASVTKAVTSLYALDALGAGYRFETYLVGTGPVVDGVLRGDLVLVGGGDPELDTDALDAMAQALARRGVTSVTGRLRPWGQAVPRIDRLNPEQPVEVAYNPTISGLALNFNRVFFEWRSKGNGSYSLSMDARSAQHVPPVRVTRIAASSREGPTYTYEDGGTFDSWTVARPRLGEGGSRWLPARKPDRYAAEVMTYFLKARGVAVAVGDPLGADPRGEVLVTHESQALDGILKGLLKYSTNLTAELCGMAATRARHGELVTLAGSAQHMTRWARTRLGMYMASCADHSGLSEISRMNAEGLSRGLCRSARDGLRPLLKPVAIRDEKGRPVENHPIIVEAKTGTLFFASSLAGYLRREGGRRDLAFAIFSVNDAKRAGINTRQEQSPPGAPDWNRRAKRLQQDLLKRWGALHA